MLPRCRYSPAGLTLIGLVAACATRPTPDAIQTRPVRYWLPPASAEEPIDAADRDAGNGDTLPVEAAGSAAGSHSGGACGNAAGQLFPPDAPWNRSIRRARTARDSARIIQYLQDNHRERHRFTVDFSMVVLQASSQTRRVRLVSPHKRPSLECDQVPVPLPVGSPARIILPSNTQ